MGLPMVFMSICLPIGVSRVMILLCRKPSMPRRFLGFLGNQSAILLRDLVGSSLWDLGRELLVLF
jgi:hypothetical protein